MAMNRKHSWNFRSLWTGTPVFAFLFLFILCLPALKSIVFPAAKYSLQEQSSQNVSPVLNRGQALDFLNAWNAYANEHFGGRDILIHWNNLLQVKLLNVSPIETIILGRDGWLFLDGPHLEMDYFRAEKPFSADELARWRRVLLQRHMWLERQGIRFLFVIAPNKSTIYPEKVSARIHRAPTRLDQLREYLQQRSLPAGFCLVDLRKTLRAAKFQYPVYDRVDSHWNRIGAWLAANKIIRLLSRFYPLHPPELKDFTVSLEPGAGDRGDLAAMLSLSGILYDSQLANVTPNSPSGVIIAEPAHWIDDDVEREVTIRPGAGLPEALMFRDSFGYALAKNLSEHFQKITYIRDRGLRFDPRIVLQVRPKIVIHEMAERFLQTVLPVNPAELEALDIDR
jgi:alginate O-acetyltransferase complex protein AlgJ